jgi:hypothetical protein
VGLVLSSAEWSVDAIRRQRAPVRMPSLAVNLTRMYIQEHEYTGTGQLVASFFEAIGERLRCLVD